MNKAQKIEFLDRVNGGVATSSFAAGHNLSAC
jgi:hypothetical protein